VTDDRVSVADGPLERVAAWLEGYRFALSMTECGTLVSVGDGIVWVAGLPSAAIDDILEFEDGSRALVLDLNPDLIGGILLRETGELSAGTFAHLAGETLCVPVGEPLLGRVVDPLGRAVDGTENPRSDERRPLERLSPPITSRDFVHKPLYTGNKIIDTLLPVGKGQRQLIVGDEGLGRTSIALDAVLNQRDKNVLCV